MTYWMTFENNGVEAIIRVGCEAAYRQTIAIIEATTMWEFTGCVITKDVLFEDSDPRRQRGVGLLQSVTDAMERAELKHELFLSHAEDN